MATVNLSEYAPLQIKDADTFRIGIIYATWNSFVTENLRDGAFQILQAEGVPAENIEVYDVPGAFELIYGSKQLCDTCRYDAVIAIGCVIRGETAHFDYVCSAVAQGIKDCNVQTDTPVIFCVLTDERKEQSIARSGGDLGNKGVEAAVTALRMIDFRRKIGG